MDYDKWIIRERKIRLKILNSSPVIKKEHIYRVCKECGEVCLCHEEICPNCNSNDIISERIVAKDFVIEEKIRCQYRFINIGKRSK